MSASVVSSQPLPDFLLWKKLKANRTLVSFNLEATARCNNNCRHCYINLPADDKAAKEKEVSLEEIKEIVDEAVSLGALWCLVTGGEPLLRDDFFDIYDYVKRKGLLVSVFTNATLITKEHVNLLRKLPPRDIEVTVYGVTQETYERVTRKPGSFDAFNKGLDLLIRNEIKVRLKAMALRSNVHEIFEIKRFCRRKTKDYFRFDPFLHLRVDGNPARNLEIKSERLSAEEIVTLERSDPQRLRSLKNNCNNLFVSQGSCNYCNHLFHCGTGDGLFTLSYDGYFRLCSSLVHPDCIYDLRKGNLSDAWHKFVPRVRDMSSDRGEFLEKCSGCPLINLCMWCPAHAHLETGEMDVWVDYFCRLAHARAGAIGIGKADLQHEMIV